MKCEHHTPVDSTMMKRIGQELREHLPFTFFGALTGIMIMFFSSRISHEIAHNVFYVLHPLHVVLSALATASMYELHRCPEARGKCNIGVILVIGYVGSIGVATLSDSIIPYVGEILLNMPHREMHVGFIEKWWLINPLAILGIAIAYFWPATKFSHSGHVLLSTWASLFHIIMAMGEAVGWLLYVAVFLFLFLAVWVPCCVSDIIFPLLFIKNKDTHQ